MHWGVQAGWEGLGVAGSETPGWSSGWKGVLGRPQGPWAGSKRPPSWDLHRVRGRRKMPDRLHAGTSGPELGLG